MLDQCAGGFEGVLAGAGVVERGRQGGGALQEDGELALRGGGSRAGARSVKRRAVPSL
ncbi:hypothetical protein [Streptomyces niveiscabiei]|uniref:hypothetical protein n=1 Tax=Streptomyces niveiscabiei TaxID=164115 RepID=UPI00131B1A02|nr:hypothetical protein [Streptomyces niveiscabiei]